MRALTVIPLKTGSAAVVDMPEPEPGEGELLVDGLAVGVCGTDNEIARRRLRLGAAGAASGWCSGTSRSGRVRQAPTAAASRPATWSSASSAGPTRCRARPARAASSTCAATAATPSAASRRCTATPASAGPSRPTTR